MRSRGAGSGVGYTIKETGRRDPHTCFMCSPRVVLRALSRSLVVSSIILCALATVGGLNLLWLAYMCGGSFVSW